jgi:membrane fusion protein, peptide pheromone/bacteriocin exporter
MKEITQKLEEITDSREILESQAHPFLAIFIYIMTIFIIVALIICYFGEIDITVKAQGVLRPNEMISTQRNIVPGKVINIFYENGSSVKKNDILYSIDPEKFEIDKKSAESQISRTKDDIYDLESLFNCITNNKTVKQASRLFKDTNSEFYFRFMNYNDNLLSLENDKNIRLRDYNLKSEIAKKGGLSQKELNDAKDALNNSIYKLQIYKSKFLYDIQYELKSNKDNLIILEKDLSTANWNIENSIVKAPIDGIINVSKEINTGDFLQGGEQIFTIVTDKKEQYKVYFYISNKDMTNISIGQKVNYRFLALPYQEYGLISGVISKLGFDSNQENPNDKVYFAEGTIINKPLYSYKGVKSELKVGMACEAQIIIESKKILFFILEKMDLTK